MPTGTFRPPQGEDRQVTLGRADGSRMDPGGLERAATGCDGLCRQSVDLPIIARDPRRRRHALRLLGVAVRRLIVARSEVRSLPGPPVIATVSADRDPVRRALGPKWCRTGSGSGHHGSDGCGCVGLLAGPRQEAMNVDTAGRLDLRGKTITTYIVFAVYEAFAAMGQGDRVEVVTDTFAAIETGFLAWCRRVPDVHGADGLRRHARRPQERTRHRPRVPDRPRAPGVRMASAG